MSYEEPKKPCCEGKNCSNCLETLHDLSTPFLLLLYHLPCPLEAKIHTIMELATSLAYDKTASCSQTSRLLRHGVERAEAVMQTYDDKAKTNVSELLKRFIKPQV